MDTANRFKWTLPISKNVVVGQELGMELIVQTMQALADQRVRMSLELAALMLTEANGVPLASTTERRAFLATLPPKEQNLLVEAYNRLHNASKDEVEGFFLTQEVVIGS